MIEMFRNNTMSFLLKVDTQGIEEMLKYIKTVSEKSEELSLIHISEPTRPY